MSLRVSCWLTNVLNSQITLTADSAAGEHTQLMILIKLATCKPGGDLPQQSLGRRHCWHLCELGEFLCLLPPLALGQLGPAYGTDPVHVCYALSHTADRHVTDELS